MPYKKADVLKLGEYRMKVLEVFGDIYFDSCSWDNAEDAEIASKTSGFMRTKFELNSNGWSLCPPDQTLLPAEKWVPKFKDQFHVGTVDSKGSAKGTQYRWCNSEEDIAALAIGNVHKTSEEAIEWAKKRYNIA